MLLYKRKAVATITDNHNIQGKRYLNMYLKER